jgi:uncharacterized protein YraI
VREGPLALRLGPGPQFAIIGMAKVGDTFAIIARSADGAWWQVCCVNARPVWLAAEFVTVTGPAENVPVGP